jgi:hypothetical protein
MPGEGRYKDPYICDDCSGATRRRAKEKKEAIRLQECVASMTVGEFQARDLADVLRLMDSDLHKAHHGDSEIKNILTIARRLIQKYTV